MGVIVKYICKHCDFVADDVCVGPGMICYQEPVMCKDCGNVMSTSIDEVTRTILPQYSHCRKCESPNLVLWNYRCPKCGSTAIDEETVGMWD